MVSATERELTDEGVRDRRLEVAPQGTLLFAMYASVGAVAELGVPATWNQALLGLAPRPGLSNSRFVRYWLEHLRPSLAGLVRSNTQDNLNAEQVGNFPFPSISVSDQRAVADFLDTETARIDALITKKRRMIDLLGERKAATMLAAVGGRLTHSGPFELSSLAWLKKRPAHWREVLIRLVAQTGSGHTPSRERPEWWENCTIPWITTGEVAQIRSDQREEILDTREKISEVGLANSAAVLHPRGTVVLCRTASAGYSGIMGVDMASSQDFATWTCGSQVRPRYLLLCLRAMRPDLLGRLATGSTHKTIYMPDIHALKIPLPSLLEQELAVEAAWRCLDPLFTAMDRLRQQIALLQEHRQALITAAVTGEMRVPGVAA
jgi:type I restriction enzyme S subunit